MEKLVFNWRYWALTVIGFFAFVCFAGEPAENDPDYWAVMILSKVAGAALVAVDWLLYTWFKDNGKIDGIREYLEKEED